MSKLPNYEIISMAKLLKDFDKELLLELSSDLFSGVHKKMYDEISAYFLANTRLPSVDVFQAEILSKAPAHVKPVIMGIMSSIKSIDTSVISKDEVVRGLRDNRLIDKLDDNMSQLVSMTANRNVDGIREVLNSLTLDLNTAGVKPKDLSDAMQEPDRSKIIPTYIEGLDDSIVGVGGLSIIAGESGGGKSIMLLNMAIQQFLNGHNVLFISLELSAQVVGQRLISYITKIPYGRIVKNLLTDTEKAQVDKSLKEFFGRDNHFRIVAEPLDSDELLALINVEKSLYDVDLVYLDYMNLVLMRSAQSSWAGLVDLARELHRISMRLGVVTVSAAQADLETKPKGDAYPSIRTRGSKELEFSSTLMVYLYSPEESPESVIIYVLKNRNGRRCRIIADKDFETMTIAPIMALE